MRYVVVFMPRRAWDATQSMHCNEAGLNKTGITMGYGATFAFSPKMKREAVHTSRRVRAVPAIPGAGGMLALFRLCVNAMIIAKKQ